MEGKNHENKKRESLGFGIEKQIGGCFLLAPIDLAMLIALIFGFDVDTFFLIGIIVGIVSFIPCEIFCHYLNKRIAAQETEDAAEDLNDDIGSISLKVFIVAFIMFLVLLFLSFDVDLSPFN
ncbi:MAG: hypothetical protein K2I95_09650 [Treponemataceae bacterium]|nr:hypothetical protein [Treponemataceae bacterium]